MSTYIIYSNWIVAIGAGTLSAGWANFHHSEKWWLYGCFGFFSTFCVYNLQRIFKITQYKPTPWLSWVNQNKGTIVLMSLLSLIGAVISIIALVNFKINPLICIFSATLISVFYVVKVVTNNNLRDIPYVKIHLISLSWVLVLILFPLTNETGDQNLMLCGVLHYAYVLAITIPFDIRDLKFDEKQKKTIPQVVGTLGSKGIALSLLVFFLIGMVYIFPELRYNLMMYLSVFVQILLVLGMNQDRPDWYCAGAIDGSIILLGIAYLMG